VGILRYGGRRLELDDRLLTHLQIVFAAKLRRREPFILSWAQPTDLGSGRRALWIDNGVPIHFQYYGSRALAVNRSWLDELIQQSSQPGGLRLGQEGRQPD
jgi:hypothetical protein